ncbi:Protein lin-9 -like protein [Halotydeus destructor]|nr:Protein lin-9 -like protein [Halotydeus destructor]
MADSSGTKRNALKISDCNSSSKMTSRADPELPSSKDKIQGSGSKYPVRNRKRNRFIFNDEEETDTVVSGGGGSGTRATNSRTVATRRSTRGSPVKSEPLPKQLDKKLAQRTGHALRTLLKLPKAHKWVCYEWFYANIDQPLFLGENDFEAYLKESFPNLKTRMLRRVEWSKIRRLMGKPRRCSAAFFTEERQALNMRRNKIRHLQQQKVVDIIQYRDLPHNIPLSLVIGTKVTAILRLPQESGLFTGIIDAVDANSGVYRLTFDKAGIGSHSVPDYEVLSDAKAEYMPLSSFQTKVRPRLPLYASTRLMEHIGNQVAQVLNDGAPLAGPSHAKGATNEEMLGGFPIKFLAMLVRLSRILAVKKKRIYELKSMNSEVEKMRSLQEPIPHEFQKQYAGTILELEKLNMDLNDYLNAVKQYTSEMCPDASQGPLQPEFMKQKNYVDSKEVVERSLGNCAVKSEKSIDLISQLLSIMLHLKGFSDGEVCSYELKSLGDAVHDTRKMVGHDNLHVMESAVEVHVNHIQSSLSHLGSLGAFSEPVDPL